MNYVTLNGLAKYAAGGYDALEEHYDGDALERMLAECEARMMAYIIPNTPADGWQESAFCNACYAQMLYETSDANRQLEDMPDGLKAFSVNGFSATLDGKAADAMSAVGLCRAARACLLRAGLLYRGVNCVC